MGERKSRKVGIISAQLGETWGYGVGGGKVVVR